MPPLSTPPPSRSSALAALPLLAVATGCIVHLGRPAGGPPVGDVQVVGLALDPALASAVRTAILDELHRCGSLDEGAPPLVVSVGDTLEPSMRGVERSSWARLVTVEAAGPAGEARFQLALPEPPPDGAAAADAARRDSEGVVTAMLADRIGGWACTAPGPVGEAPVSQPP